MFLFRNNKTVYSVLGVLFLLGGCANAPFPELDGDESTVEGEKTVLKESKSLASDQKNAAYEGDEIPDEDKVEAAKTKPVKKADASFDDDEKVLEQTEKDFPELFGDKDSEKKYSAAEEKEVLPSVSYRMETFYFDNGSAVLSGKYNAQIRNIAKLAKQKKAMVNVYGYASSRTRNTDAVSHKLANFNISMKRAESVALALRRAGVPAKQIQVEALSDTVPAYQEVMPEGERLNRRAEVYISY